MIALRHRIRGPTAVAMALVLALVILVLLTTGRDAPFQSASPPTADPVFVQSGEELRRTYASLRQIDDHPLYAMTFHGGYNPEAPWPQDLTRVQAAASQWACSLFLASGDQARPLFGRNFDWDHNPAMVVHSDPPDGYASMSLVDISYVLGGASPPDLNDPATRARLRYAALLPFDGVNEKGLAVGMAAVPRGDGPRLPGRPTLNGVRVMRIMLDRASTVDEAVAVMGSYNVEANVGPPLHYMVSDASGRSAVLELVDGQLSVLPGRGPWNLAVNFLLTGASEDTKSSDWRWRTASSSLDKAGGTMDWRTAMDLLKRIAQEHTQWSAVYDLKAGTLRVATGKRYGAIREFDVRKPG